MAHQRREVRPEKQSVTMGGRDRAECHPKIEHQLNPEGGHKPGQGGWRAKGEDATRGKARERNGG